MAKKTFFLLSALLLIFSLTACSAMQLPWASATQTSSLSNFASQPVKNKLAVGLLELQGSDQVITTAQAKELLPLWKAVKSLSNDSNTTSGEMTALYVQIEGVLTNTQLQTIQKLDLSTSELTAMVQKYGTQTVLNTSDSTSTTSQTVQTSQMQGGASSDIQGVGMQDFSLGGIEGVASVATQSSTSTGTSASTSSTVSQTSLNLQLADSVISLLETRISSLGS